MMQIITNSSLEQIVRLDRVQVLKSNPTLRSNGIIYYGKGFSVEKEIVSVQTNWNGKKIIKLKTGKVIDNSKIEVKEQETKEEGKKNYGKDLGKKTNRVN